MFAELFRVALVFQVKGVVCRGCRHGGFEHLSFFPFTSCPLVLTLPAKQLAVLSHSITSEIFSINSKQEIAIKERLRCYDTDTVPERHKREVEGRRIMGIDRLKTSEANIVLAYDHEMLDIKRRKRGYTRDYSEEIVSGHSDDVPEICVGPDCFDICDDILLFSLFRNSHVFHEKGYGYGKPEQIQVKVLVSALVICLPLPISVLICFQLMFESPVPVNDSAQREFRFPRRRI
jgi:hypothetical protein